MSGMWSGHSHVWRPRDAIFELVHRAEDAEALANQLRVAAGGRPLQHAATAVAVWPLASGA